MNDKISRGSKERANPRLNAPVLNFHELCIGREATDKKLVGTLEVGSKVWIKTVLEFFLHDVEVPSP